MIIFTHVSDQSTSAIGLPEVVIHLTSGQHSGFSMTFEPWPLTIFTKIEDWLPVETKFKDTPNFIWPPDGDITPSKE